MFKTHFENGLHMVIFKCIKNIFAVASEFDKLGIFQNFQLM